MDYWKECISEAFDEAGITATEEQIAMVAGDVQVSHENYGMAFGHDCIPNPLEAEVKKLKDELKNKEDNHERCLDGIREGVAMRRNVHRADVHIEVDGNVTYDRR